MVSIRREASTDQGLATMGDRLRQARTARGWSLRAMAKRLGVSPSLISQVETGRAKPSVSTLYALANELGISLDELLFMDVAPSRVVDGTPLADPYASDLPRDPVQRANARESIRLGSGVVWERLTSESLRNADFLFVTYEVGGASSPANAYQRHKGQEWGFVLSGTLRINIAFEEFILGPGDSITFDSSAPHRLSNDGDQPAQAIWFVLGRRTRDPASTDDRAP